MWPWVLGPACSGQHFFYDHCSEDQEDSSQSHRAIPVSACHPRRALALFPFSPPPRLGFLSPAWQSVTPEPPDTIPPARCDTWLLCPLSCFRSPGNPSSCLCKEAQRFKPGPEPSSLQTCLACGTFLLVWIPAEVSRTRDSPSLPGP